MGPPGVSARSRGSGKGRWVGGLPFSGGVGLALLLGLPSPPPPPSRSVPGKRRRWVLQGPVAFLPPGDLAAGGVGAGLAPAGTPRAVHRRCIQGQAKEAFPPRLQVVWATLLPARECPQSDDGTAAAANQPAVSEDGAKVHLL